MLDNMVMGNSMWHLVRQSDFVSKFVLLVLFFMSMLCWTIFIAKIFILRSRRRDMQRALDHVRMARSMEDLAVLSTSFNSTIPGNLTTSLLRMLKQMAHGAHKDASSDWEFVQFYLEQEIEQIIINEESYLPVLSTSAAVATLLGLFGTVWGLIHAFIGISEKQTADIAAVAPGIAEALITTLAGLIVAIPALVMYNYLAHQVRSLEHKVVSFADKISFIVQNILRG